MKRKKRHIELVVISDVHLGTLGCRARELLQYLKSIKPKVLILNGDIIDIWQFSKRYWPKSHMKVVKYIIGLAAKKTRIYYLPGNHDEMLRKFAGTHIGNIEIVNTLELNLNGKKAWFFHGDVFDVFMQHSKWLAKAGAVGYGLLIFLNMVINHLRQMAGAERISFSKKVKDNVKKAVSFINNFEETAASHALKKEFDFIVCGHIHHPEIKEIHTPQGKSIVYLNSGDWIENLSALEYNRGEWRMYNFTEDTVLHDAIEEPADTEFSVVEMDNKSILNLMIKEIQN